MMLLRRKMGGVCVIENIREDGPEDADSLNRNHHPPEPRMGERVHQRQCQTY